MGADLEHRIADLARRQHGVVTRAQMLGRGLKVGAIRHAEAGGRLLRLHRGVYLVGPLVPPRAREMAAVLACGRRALLADWSAAGLWGFGPPPEEHEEVHVLTVGPAAKQRPGISVRRVLRLDARDRVRLDGIPVTGAARTLLDLAASAEPAALELAVARAERQGLVRPKQLAARLAKCKGRAGTAALTAVLRQSGGPRLTRSEAEARFLALVRDAQLPPPEVNVRVAGRELDFLWRDHGIAVEVDGYRFHSSRTSFEDDRRRISDLAASGIHVIPITWTQVVQEAMATAVRLGQALLQAKLHRAP